MKKSHSKLSKNPPVCISKRLVCWIRAGGVVLCVRRGNCLKHLKRGSNRNEGSGKKHFKRGGQAGLRGGCLKKGAGTPLRTMKDKVNL